MQMGGDGMPSASSGGVAWVEVGDVLQRVVIGIQLVDNPEDVLDAGLGLECRA